MVIICHVSLSLSLQNLQDLSGDHHQPATFSQIWNSTTPSCGGAFKQTRSISEMSLGSAPDFFDESFFEDCYCETEGKNCEFHHQNQGQQVNENENRGVQQVEINQSFPRRPIQEELASMIEYRIKILLNYDEILKPGQTKEVQTNLTVKRKCGNLSLLILSADLKTTRFCSEGFLSPNMRGRLSVTLNNPQNSDVYLAAGTIVSFLVLAPFVN